MSAVTSPTITPTIACWWLDFYGEGGYKPGSFTQSIMRAIVSADSEHKAVMRHDFAGLVQGFELANCDLEGLRALAVGADGPADLSNVTKR